MEIRKHDSTMKRMMRDLREGAAVIITLFDFLMNKQWSNVVCEQ